MVGAYGLAMKSQAEHDDSLLIFVYTNDCCKLLGETYTVCRFYIHYYIYFGLRVHIYGRTAVPPNGQLISMPVKRLVIVAPPSILPHP